MFALSRPLRRVVALVVFGALALAPTGFVSLTAYRIHRGSYPAEVARQMSGLLGFEVEIGGIQYPRPREVRYRGIVLRDRESQLPIASCDGLTVKPDDDLMVVQAQGVQVHAEQPAVARQQLDQLLSRARGLTYHEVSLLCPEVRVTLGPHSFALHEVVGRYSPSDQEPTAVFSFAVAGIEKNELEIRRLRQGESPVTLLEFRGGDGALPVAVLGPYLGVDLAQLLGDRATFEVPKLTVAESDAGWTVSYQGSLKDIDLDRVVTGQFPPQRLSGKAHLEVAELQWQSDGIKSRIASLRGTLRGGPGQINASMLESLRTSMHFGLDPRQEPAGAENPEVVDYEQLGLAFAITPRGTIDIRGQCVDQPGAVMLTPAGGALVHQPTQSATTLDLVRMLVPNPDRAVVVPVKGGAGLILDVLPHPSDPARPANPAGNILTDQESAGGDDPGPERVAPKLDQREARHRPRNANYYLEPSPHGW